MAMLKLWGSLLIGLKTLTNIRQKKQQIKKKFATLRAEFLGHVHVQCHRVDLSISQWASGKTEDSD